MWQQRHGPVDALRGSSSRLWAAAYVVTCSKKVPRFSRLERGVRSPPRVRGCTIASFFWKVLWVDIGQVALEVEKRSARISLRMSSERLGCFKKKKSRRRCFVIVCERARARQQNETEPSNALLPLQRSKNPSPSSEEQASLERSDGEICILS